VDKQASKIKERTIKVSKLTSVDHCPGTAQSGIYTYWWRKWRKDGTWGASTGHNCC